MQSERRPGSPLDPYIRQVLDFVNDNGQVSMSALGDTCSREFTWLPGFCDVVITFLRTNNLIVVHEWEPGKIHVTARGLRWLAAQDKAQSVSG